MVGRVHVLGYPSVGFRKAGELGNWCEGEKSEIVFKWPP